MSREVALFGVVLLSAAAMVSHAVPMGDMILSGPAEYRDAAFDTGIMHVDPAFFAESGTKRYVVMGQNGPSVMVLHPSVAQEVAARGHHIIEDVMLEFDSEYPDGSGIGAATGSLIAAERYNATGRGVTVGIVDSGVDFSNLDLRDSLARDDLNHPLMLDSDGQGIILTNSTFFAYIDQNGLIRNYSKPVPEGFTSSIYHTRDGVFLNLSQGGDGTQVPVYNSFYPRMGAAPTFNGTLIEDMKIGESNRDYIRSQSGEYHLGVMYQGSLEGQIARVQVVPVLVVDSHESGVYDTIIPDLSTSWEDYTRFDLDAGQSPDYDFDFTDERPIVLGSGNEFMTYDSDGDGVDDYSAGVVGARVLDIHGVFSNKTAHIDDVLLAINGTLLDPFDSGGDYFGVMTDFRMHGTSSASTAASRGVQTYNLYNDTRQHVLPGVAPDATILPIKALWYGDVLYAWMWGAGFENDGDGWAYSGSPRADILSNSWSIVSFPMLGTAPGTDMLSFVGSMLSVPSSLHDDFPGVVMVMSAGNSGPGYGTMTTPAASPLGISVGASTSNVFVGHGPFQGQPRFGNSTEHGGHMVDFSSRGPSIIGDPKPDISSTGAFGFVPIGVLRGEKDSKVEPFSMYGGTSMSAPMVAGGAALLVQSLQDQQREYDSFYIKNVLMSTAADAHNDPFVQGSGLFDAESALDLLNGRGGTFMVHNDASYRNILGELAPALSVANATRIGLEDISLPAREFPMTGWFAGKLAPGERSTATFTIENPGESPIDVEVRPRHLVLAQSGSTDGTTMPKQKDPVMDKESAFAPNYVRLSDIKRHDGLGDFFDGSDPIPGDASLLSLAANFEFGDFMNKTDDTYANDLKIASLYLYDWNDADDDAYPTADELSLVSRAGSWGTVQELRVSDPASRFEGTPLVGVYPVPMRFSYWEGNTMKNSTAFDYSLSAYYYKKEAWPVVWTDTESVSVPAKGASEVNLSLVVPSDMRPGNYQGFVTFEGERHAVNAPVSFTVVLPMDGTDGIVLAPGQDDLGMMHAPGQIRGAFDMASRYTAGDWIQYNLEVGDVRTDHAAIEISWEHEDTNLAVLVADPQGRLIHNTMPPGAFGPLLDWVSLDWLGRGQLGSGGFYPVKGTNATTATLIVPINQTGTYSVLAHSTLFGGSSVAEPVSMAARFVDMRPGVVAEPDAGMPGAVLADDPSASEEIIQVEDVSPGTTPDDVGDSVMAPTSQDVLGLDPDSGEFNYGLALGAGIGIAVGLLSFIIVRSKPRDPAPAPFARHGSSAI